MPVKRTHAKVNDHCLILLKRHLSERAHYCGGICNPTQFCGSDRSTGRTLGQYIPQPISCLHRIPCLSKPPQFWPPCSWLTLCWAPTPEPVPSCSLPKRNSTHCARAASSSSSCLFPQCSSLYTQQPRCSRQPFYTFPLLLASFHRSLLSASTQRFVQRTKLLSLPV